MSARIYCFFALLISALSGLFVNYLFSQKLPAAQYGVYFLIIGALTIISSLVMLGQATAINVVYFSDEKSKHSFISKEIYKNLQIISIVLLIAIFVGFVFHSRIAFKSESLLLLFFLAVWGKVLQDYFYSLILCHAKFNYYFLFSLAFALILCAGVLIYTSIAAYLLLNFFIGLAVAILIFNYARSRKQPAEDYHTFSYRALIMLGIAALPTIFVNSLNATADRFLIAHFLDLSSVAYYGLAASCGVGAGQLLTQAMTRPVYVEGLKALQEADHNKFQKVISNVAITFGLINVIFFFANYFLTAPLFILIFRGKLINSIPFIYPLFVAVTVTSIAQVFTLPYIQKKKIYINLINCGVSFLVNVLLCVCLIPIFAIRGAIVSVMLAGVVNLLMSYWLTQKLIKVKMPWLFLFISSIAFFMSLNIVPSHLLVFTK